MEVVLPSLDSGSRGTCATLGQKARRGRTAWPSCAGRTHADFPTSRLCQLPRVGWWKAELQVLPPDSCRRCFRCPVDFTPWLAIPEKSARTLIGGRADQGNAVPRV